MHLLCRSPFKWRTGKLSGQRYGICPLNSIKFLTWRIFRLETETEKKKGNNDDKSSEAHGYDGKGDLVAFARIAK